MSKFPILPEKESLQVTTEIISLISAIQDPHQMMIGFHYYEGMLTSMAKMICAQDSIERIDSHLRGMNYEKDKTAIDSFLELREDEHKSELDGAENVKIYKEKLLQLGIIL